MLRVLSEEQKEEYAEIVSDTLTRLDEEQLDYLEINNFHDFIRYCIDNHFQVYYEYEGTIFIMPIEALKVDLRGRSLFLPHITYRLATAETKKHVADKLNLRKEVYQIGVRTLETGEEVPTYYAEADYRYDISTERNVLHAYDVNTISNNTLIIVNDEEAYEVDAESITYLLQLRMSFSFEELRLAYLQCHGAKYLKPYKVERYTGGYTTKWEVRQCKKYGVARYTGSPFVTYNVSDVVYFKRDKLASLYESPYTYNEQALLFEILLYELTVNHSVEIEEQEYRRAWKQLGVQGGQRELRIELNSAVVLPLQHYWLHRQSALRRKSYEPFY